MLHFQFVTKIAAFNITKYINVNPKPTPPIINPWLRHSSGRSALHRHSLKDLIGLGWWRTLATPKNKIASLPVEAPKVTRVNFRVKFPDPPPPFIEQWPNSHGHYIVSANSRHYAERLTCVLLCLSFVLRLLGRSTCFACELCCIYLRYIGRYTWGFVKCTRKRYSFNSPAFTLEA